jgi:hypothetical protein
MYTPFSNTPIFFHSSIVVSTRPYQSCLENLHNLLKGHRPVRNWNGSQKKMMGTPRESHGFIIHWMGFQGEIY